MLDSTRLTVEGDADQATEETWAPAGAGANDNGQSVARNDVSGNDTGVFASAPREKTHLWKPGQSGNPTGRSNADRALIRHIHASFQPAEVVQMIRDAYTTAKARGSWRGQLEVARFIAEYTIGKPVQRSVTVSSRAGELLQQLASVQLEPDDHQTIEITASEQ